MEGIRQGENKASTEDSIAKLAQQMYYQLLDEHNELIEKAKKRTSKIIINLSLIF